MHESSGDAQSTNEFFIPQCALTRSSTAADHAMQCTSFLRDPYEHTAWQLYLRECALRAAREEVAFLEATGGVSEGDLARIRQGVLCFQGNNNNEVNNAVNANLNSARTATISLKSILAEVAQTDAVNQLCRCVRPLLEKEGIATFKKHQAIHVLRDDVQRVRDLGLRVLTM